MKRQSPHLALKVAQLRVDAAVTITITGKAGSGKSTAAEIIAKSLAENGYNTAVIESNDRIAYEEYRARQGRDDRLFLTVVEDSNVAYKPEAKADAGAPETTEKECDGNCEDCGKEVPPLIKLLLTAAALRKH